MPPKKPIPELFFFYKGTGMPFFCSPDKPRVVLKRFQDNAHDIIVKERADGLTDSAIIDTYREQIDQMERMMVNFTKNKRFEWSLKFMKDCYGNDYRTVHVAWCMNVLMLLELGAIVEGEMNGTMIMG